MNAPFISIIIPAYNVEAYIARCLDSAINQTLANIEIIVVDDCGSDKSIEIAKSYAARDCRIKIVRNPRNLGLFWARIAGESKAKGEYVLALDSDDYLENITCKALYKRIFECSGAISEVALFANPKKRAIAEANSKDLDEISGLRRFEREDRTKGSSPKRKSSLPEISLNTEFDGGGRIL